MIRAQALWFGGLLALGLAAPRLVAEELPDLYQGVRPLGMGGAFTAVANDENSVWTNPAGIARVRKARSRQFYHLINMPTLISGGNEGGRRFALNLLGKATSSGPDILEDVLNDLEENDESNLWVRVATSAMIFFDNPKGSPWVLGLFTNSRTTITPDPTSDADDREVLVDSVTDMGGVITMGWTNRTNRLNASLQLRPTMRYEYYGQTPESELATEYSTKIRDEGNSGFGMGIDTGVMWTVADYWFPTIGVAIRNLPTGCQEDYLNPYAQVRQTVCGTTYTGDVNNADSPARVDPTDIRIGVSMTPRLTRKVSLRFAIDMHHIYFSPDNSTYYGLSGVEPLKQLHAGMEMFVGNPLLINPLSLRVGYNQGFFTAGGSFRVGLLALEAAMYEQDISTSATGEKDTRYIGSLSLELH